MSDISDKVNESFLHGPSKVDDVMAFANEILKGKEDKKKTPQIKKDVRDFNFMVFERAKITQPKRSRFFSKRNIMSVNVNQLPVMRQIGVSDEERKKARVERMQTAKTFRRLGNSEYRKGNFDKAIEHYSSGLNFISDSPVLYVNRSISLIKKREYKRASWDLEYVVRALDPECVRAWCCLAGVNKRMGNDEAYEHCISKARLYGRRTGQEYVENFIVKIKSDF